MRFSELLALVMIGAALAAGTASAGIVGVDASSGAYTGPGVLDTASRTWELKPSTGDTFLLDGQTITMTYGTNWAGGVDAPIDLFDNYKHNNGGAAFGVVLTGLDLSKQYNLVVYGAQNHVGGRGGSFDPVEPNLPAKSTTGDQQSTFAEGVNYVRFDNVAPDNTAGDQRIRFLVGNGPDGIGIFNGFEIESFVPSPTLLQYGFDHTAGTVQSQGGIVVDDGGRGNDGLVITGNGGTYSADVPSPSSLQNTTGIGSLGTASGAVRTANDVVDYSDILGAGGLTMEAWIKGGSSGQILSIDGAYNLVANASGAAFANGFGGPAPGGVFDTSQWHHVAGVLSNPAMAGANLVADLNLYVDGVLVDGVTGSTFVADLDRGAAVGNHPWAAPGSPVVINSPFNGLVFEPRITLGALGPDEFTFARIPEPSTIALLLVGGLALLPWIRRRRRK